MTDCNNLGDLPEPPEPNKLTYNKVGGPLICEHPSIDGKVCPCAWFQLSVIAGDCSGDAEFQWYIGESGDDSTPIEDGDNVIGSTGPVLRARICEDTEFWVRVTNPNGSCQNSESVLVELEPFAVQITEQPVFTSEGGVVCTNTFGTIEMQAETCIGSGGFSDTKNNELAKVSVVQPFYDGMIEALGFDIEVAYADEFILISDATRGTVNATSLQTLLETITLIGVGNVQVTYESEESPNDPIYPWADIPAPDNFIIEFINELECQPLPFNLSFRAITKNSHTGVAGSGVDAYCNPDSNPLLVELTKGQERVVVDTDLLNDPDKVCYEWYEGLSGDTSKPVMNQNPDPDSQNTLFVAPPEDTSYWARVRSHACIEAGCEDYYVDSDTVFVTTVESLSLVDPIEPTIIQPDVTNIFQVGVVGETPTYQWYGGKLLNPDVVVQFGTGTFDTPTIGNTYRVSTNGAGQDYTPWGGPDLTDVIAYPDGGVGETFVATDSTLSIGERVELGGRYEVVVAGDYSRLTTESGASSAGVGFVFYVDIPEASNSYELTGSESLLRTLQSGMELGDISKPLYNAGDPSAVLNNTVSSGAQGPQITFTGQQTRATGLASIVENSPPTLKVAGETVAGNKLVEVLIDGDYTSIGGTTNQLVGDQFLTTGIGGQLDDDTAVNVINVKISSTYLWLLAENVCNSIEQGIYDIVSYPFFSEELTWDFSFPTPSGTLLTNVTPEFSYQPDPNVQGVKEVTMELSWTFDDQIVKEMTMEFAFTEPPAP